jgi:hypothetical protein
VRTTIEIPDPLFRRAKLLALQRHLTLKELINRALSREVDSPEVISSRMTVPPIGLELTPEAGPLTNAQMAELLEADDLRKAGQ